MVDVVVDVVVDTFIKTAMKILFLPAVFLIALNITLIAIYF